MNLSKKAVHECTPKTGDQVFRFPWSKNHIKLYVQYNILIEVSKGAKIRNLFFFCIIRIKNL